MVKNPTFRAQFLWIPFPRLQSNPISCKVFLRLPKFRTVFWSNPVFQKYPSRPYLTVKFSAAWRLTVNPIKTLQEQKEELSTFFTQRKRKTDTRGRGVEEKEESIVLLFIFKALKRNVFTITLYRTDVMFMRRFCQSANNQYQLTSIYLSIVIENQYQSTTTQISTIDWSFISSRVGLSISIGIDWYRLSSIIDWIRWGWWKECMDSVMFIQS